MFDTQWCGGTHIETDILLFTGDRAVSGQLKCIIVGNIELWDYYGTTDEKHKLFITLVA